MTRRNVKAASKPAIGMPAGVKRDDEPQPGTAEFEQLHPRDASGSFTAGADANNGSQQDRGTVTGGVPNGASSVTRRGKAPRRRAVKPQSRHQRHVAHEQHVEQLRQDYDSAWRAAREAGLSREEARKDPKVLAAARAVRASDPGRAGVRTDAERAKTDAAAAALRDPKKPKPTKPKRRPRRRTTNTGPRRPGLDEALIRAVEEANMKQHGEVEVKRSDPPPNLEHKTMTVSGLKVVDEKKGIVETIVSVTGIVDEVRDVIEPGAYTDTLDVRTPKGVWSHDWDSPVAKALEVTELPPGDPRLPRTTPNGKPWPPEAGAVKVLCQFNLGTQRGRDAFSDVDFYGDQQEWSIGYNVPRGGAVTGKDGIRRIKRLDWYEFSPVLFGAMPLARTQGTKGIGEAKALRGSMEWINERLSEACREALVTDPDKQHGWVQATLPDVVVFYLGEGSQSRTYSMTWDMDEDGTVTLGDPIQVRVEESLVPDDRPPLRAPSPLGDTEAKEYLDPAEVLAQETYRTWVAPPSTL